MSHTEYYEQKLRQGLYYQDFVVEKLYEIGIPIISYSSKEYQQVVGENKAGLEIKNDSLWKKTGNLYIEISEKTRKENELYVPSGIYRDDNTWLYLIGDNSRIFIFSKRQLRYIHKTNKFKEIENNTKTSLGFLLPVDKAEKFYAVYIIEC